MAKIKLSQMSLFSSCELYTRAKLALVTTCLLLPPKANTQTKSHIHIFKPSKKTGLHHKTLLATNMSSVPQCSFTLVFILIVTQPFLIISNMSVTMMHDKQIQLQQQH